MAKGLKEGQAESIVTIVANSKEQDLFKLVTKEQVNAMREETKVLVNALREETKGVVNVLREEMKAEMASFKYDLLKWMLPFLIGIIIAIFCKH